MPNQSDLKAATVAAEAVSMKMTDSPAPMLVMPFSATDRPKEPLLSSIFQPVMSMAWLVELVTSNQSAATGLLPLDHGATSEMNSLPTVPGEPISFASALATAPPFWPTALSWVMTTSLAPLALLKLRNGALEEVPKSTRACTWPEALNRLTASPPVLRPTPEPW